MKKQRENRLPSDRRHLSPEQSLAHFEEMKKGTPEGLRWCIRARISFDDNNGALRDPVIYRCNATAHHRTGSAWVFYPTYDFACPIVDSMEGVTHALRTLEYRDRNAQYQWILDALNLRTVQVWDFARMNFRRTLLSKRKLTKLVETGIVWGWDGQYRFRYIHIFIQRTNYHQRPAFPYYSWHSPSLDDHTCAP